MPDEAPPKSPAIIAWEACNPGKPPEGSQYRLFLVGWNSAITECVREAGKWGQGKQGLKASDAIVRALGKKHH